jgi:hypothetical protein
LHSIDLSAKKTLVIEIHYVNIFQLTSMLWIWTTFELKNPTCESFTTHIIERQMRTFSRWVRKKPDTIKKPTAALHKCSLSA